MTVAAGGGDALVCSGCQLHLSRRGEQGDVSYVRQGNEVVCADCLEERQAMLERVSGASRSHSPGSEASTGYSVTRNRLLYRYPSHAYPHGAGAGRLGLPPPLSTPETRQLVMQDLHTTPGRVVARGHSGSSGDRGVAQKVEAAVEKSRQRDSALTKRLLNLQKGGRVGIITTDGQAGNEIPRRWRDNTLSSSPPRRRDSEREREARRYTPRDGMYAFTVSGAYEDGHAVLCARNAPPSAQPAGILSTRSSRRSASRGRKALRFSIDTAAGDGADGVAQPSQHPTQPQVHVHMPPPPGANATYYERWCQRRQRLEDLFTVYQRSGGTGTRRGHSKSHSPRSPVSPRAPNSPGGDSVRSPDPRSARLHGDLPETVWTGSLRERVRRQPYNFGAATFVERGGGGGTSPRAGTNVQSKSRKTSDGVSVTSSAGLAMTRTSSHLADGIPRALNVDTSPTNAERVARLLHVPEPQRSLRLRDNAIDLVAGDAPASASASTRAGAPHSHSQSQSLIGISHLSRVGGDAPGGDGGDDDDGARVEHSAFLSTASATGFFLRSSTASAQAATAPPPPSSYSPKDYEFEFNNRVGALVMTNKPRPESRPTTPLTGPHSPRIADGAVEPIALDAPPGGAQRRATMPLGGARPPADVVPAQSSLDLATAATTIAWGGGGVGSGSNDAVANATGPTGAKPPLSSSPVEVAAAAAAGARERSRSASPATSTAWSEFLENSPPSSPSRARRERWGLPVPEPQGTEGWNANTSVNTSRQTAASSSTRRQQQRSPRALPSTQTPDGGNAPRYSRLDVSGGGGHPPSKARSPGKHDASAARKVHVASSRQRRGGRGVGSGAPTWHSVDVTGCSSNTGSSKGLAGDTTGELTGTALPATPLRHAHEEATPETVRHRAGHIAPADTSPLIASNANPNTSHSADSLANVKVTVRTNLVTHGGDGSSIAQAAPLAPDDVNATTNTDGSVTLRVGLPLTEVTAAGMQSLLQQTQQGGAVGAHSALSLPMPAEGVGTALFSDNMSASISEVITGTSGSTARGAVAATATTTTRAAVDVLSDASASVSGSYNGGSPGAGSRSRMRVSFVAGDLDTSQQSGLDARGTRRESNRRRSSARDPTRDLFSFSFGDGARDDASSGSHDSGEFRWDTRERGTPTRRMSMATLDESEAGVSGVWCEWLGGLQEDATDSTCTPIAREEWKGLDVYDAIRVMQPQVRVIGIARVVNEAKQRVWEARKARLGAGDEHMVFHGTHERLLSSVIAKGFASTTNPENCDGVAAVFTQDPASVYVASDLALAIPFSNPAGQSLPNWWYGRASTATVREYLMTPLPTPCQVKVACATLFTPHCLDAESAPGSEADEPWLRRMCDWMVRDVSLLSPVQYILHLQIDDSLPARKAMRSVSQTPPRRGRVSPAEGDGDDDDNA